MDKNKQIQRKASQPVRTHLEKIAEQIQDRVITKPNCKLCNSKFRTDAEKMYEQLKGNYTAIEKFLSKNNEEISYHAIRNHFKMHYETQKMDLQVKEYIDNLAKFRIEREDKKSALLERKLILEHHMVNLVAMGQGATNSEDMRKDANALKSLSDAILGIEKELIEMEEAQKPAIAILQIITKIVEGKIRSSSSQEHKADLKDILDKLEDQAKDIVLEK